MTTERLTGLMLEVEMNRTVSERLMKHLADFVAGGAYPLQRLRASATVAFLEQPLIMDVKFLNDLHKYWMISGMINQMADSADVTIGGADFARKRAQTAIEKIPEQTAIGLEIQKFAAAALIKLGVTTLRD